MHLTDEAEPAGLGPEQRRAAADAAAAAGLDGWLLELVNTTGQDWLARLDRQDVRRRVFEASVGRGASGPNATGATVVELARLRARRAALEARGLAPRARPAALPQPLLLARLGRRPRRRRLLRLHVGRGPRRRRLRPVRRAGGRRRRRPQPGGGGALPPRGPGARRLGRPGRRLPRLPRGRPGRRAPGAPPHPRPGALTGRPARRLPPGPAPAVGGPASQVGGEQPAERHPDPPRPRSGRLPHRWAASSSPRLIAARPRRSLICLRQLKPSASRIASGPAASMAGSRSCPATATLIP